MKRPHFRVLFAVAIVVAFAGLVILVVVNNAANPEDSQLYLARELAETGASNRVAGIYLNYRLLDTLLEVLVFSVAVLGVRHYLRKSDQVDLPDLPESEVVRTAVSFLSPLALLLCMFFAVFGHISPGGGFAAGVIAASALLYVAIAHGMEATEAKLNPVRLAMIEEGILLGLLFFVLAPIVTGRAPLTDLLPKGEPGQLISAGSIPIYNLLIMAKVFLGSWLVIAAFAQHRGEL